VDAGFGSWLFAVSVGASALGGMLGMASGIFIVPILTLFGGVDLRTAIGASIVSVIACSCGSAASFLEGGLTNVRLAIVLEIATTLGALTGVFFVGLAPVRFLYGLFAVVLLVSARQMFARRSDPIGTSIAEPPGNWADKLRLHASYPDHLLGRSVTYKVRNVADVRRRHDLGATWDWQRRAQDSCHGHRPPPADQGVLGNLQFHDWGDCGRQRGGVLYTGLHRSLYSRSRRLGLSSGINRRSPHLDASLK
jgi:hypothetical protein